MERTDVSGLPVLSLVLEDATLHENGPHQGLILVDRNGTPVAQLYGVSKWKIHGRVNDVARLSVTVDMKAVRAEGVGAQFT